MMTLATTTNHCANSKLAITIIMYGHLILLVELMVADNFYSNLQKLKGMEKKSKNGNLDLQSRSEGFVDT